MPRSKFTESEIATMRHLYSRGVSSIEIATQFDCSYSVVLYQIGATAKSKVVKRRFYSDHATPKTPPAQTTYKKLVKPVKMYQDIVATQCSFKILRGPHGEAIGKELFHPDDVKKAVRRATHGRYKKLAYN